MDKDHMNLAMWAIKCIQSATAYLIIDLYLKGNIIVKCFSKFIEIVESYVCNQGIEWPTIYNVVRGLEFTL